MDKYEKVLEVYLFEEILQDNDLELPDVLRILEEEGYIKLPEEIPL